MIAPSRPPGRRACHMTRTVCVRSSTAGSSLARKRSGIMRTRWSARGLQGSAASMPSIRAPWTVVTLAASVAVPGGTDAGRDRCGRRRRGSRLVIAAGVGRARAHARVRRARVLLRRPRRHARSIPGRPRRQHPLRSASLGARVHHPGRSRPLRHVAERRTRRSSSTSRLKAASSCRGPIAVWRSAWARGWASSR